jgi:hypothetical protein
MLFGPERSGQPGALYRPTVRSTSSASNHSMERVGTRGIGSPCTSTRSGPNRWMVSEGMSMVVFYPGEKPYCISGKFSLHDDFPASFMTVFMTFAC